MLYRTHEEVFQLRSRFRERSHALGILFELPIFLEDMIDEYIKKAVLNAKIINTIIFEGEITASVKKEEVETEKEKTDEEEEKESAPGIGGLFGWESKMKNLKLKN